jgi:hypothetical protein
MKYAQMRLWVQDRSIYMLTVGRYTFPIESLSSFLFIGTGGSVAVAVAGY